MNSRPTILIVEDERLIALDLSRRLPKLGYDVCAIASTGEDAIAKAGEFNPSLILMDICLKGDMDGIIAAETIRGSRDVPIVFLTANSDEKTLERAKLTRPSSYLLKPFKERELQIGIDMALLNQKLQNEIKEAHATLGLRVQERTAELAQANDLLRGEIETRKMMEQQAREQADLLAKARDAIYVRDLTGVVSYWNRSAERLYGVTAQEAIGLRAQSILGESGDIDAERAERATLRHGEWNGELKHTTAAGVQLIVESRWTLVRDENGSPKTILVVNTDITERKRIAEQFLRAQRLESIGALASGIAHDLNNIFAPILMATELLTPPDKESVAIVDMLRSTARRGADMIKQVLVFVRGGESEFLPTDLAHLAAEVEKLMKGALPCAITLSLKKAPDFGHILGDGTQLHQVMVNLCVNARDAMPDGGTLGLELDNVAVSASQASRHPQVKPGDFVRIRVSDTGTGMTEDVKARIFEPFFTTKEAGKGTGLGLSTVVSIVRAHKGFVEVDSTVGVGSAFSVYLPRWHAPDESEALATALLPDGRGERVLVVDDEYSVREMTKLTLEAHGYRVELAGDGVEAIELYCAEREPVALVITDIMMPGMNGRALIRELRKRTPDLLILAFSGSDASNPLVATLNEDGVPLLRKPATSSQLLVAVERMLHGEPGAPVPACGRIAAGSV